jgi:hypothetical protein
MILLSGHDKVVAEWVGKKNGKAFSPPFSALGVIDCQGTLRGGFVFTGYTNDAVELSLAGRGCASRNVWSGVLDYVFRQLGCSRLQIHTRRSNRAVRRQAPRLGFRFEGIARRMYGREDGITYSLTADDLDGFRTKWRL